MDDNAPILIHSFSGVLGGSEKILLDLIRNAPMPLVLACPDGALADGAAAADIPVLRIKTRALESRGGISPAKAGISIASYGKEVASIIRATSPSLEIAWGMRSAIGSLAARRRPGRTSAQLRKVPVVAQHVDLLPQGRQGDLARMALLSADRVICLSNAIASDLDDHWSTNQRLVVRYPAVAAPELCPSQPNGDVSVLMLAAIEPWKGHELALEAVAQTHGVKLVVAGTPLSARGEHLLSQLKRRSSQPDLAGRVTFPGRIDPSDALAHASILLHTAPAEPFGMAMAEALAAGRPVVASRSAGALEIVDDSCGILAAPNQASEFAAALQKVCESRHLRSDLGAQGHRKVSSKFAPAQRHQEWWDTVGSHRTTRRLPAASIPAGSGLSLVTVIHNSAPDLSRLLASVSRHLPAAQVIVVDSGSVDAGPAIASLWEGSADVVTLDGNLGFGAGCVAGLKLADREVTALINPDIELIDDSIDSLAKSLASANSPDRLLTPALIHSDGQLQDAVHPIPGARAEVLRAAIPAAVLPQQLAAFTEPHRSIEPTRVGWAVAACLLGRTSTLRLLGPFDPEVHLYAEDLDLCLRAANAGIETWYRPDARVIHREAHSSAAVYGGEPSLLLAERRRSVIGDRLGSEVVRKDDIIQLLTHTNRLVIKRLLGRSSTLERARIAALRQAKRSTH